MGCNCKGDKTKINKLKNIMKNNVSYRLKKGAMKSGSYFLFGGQKYYADTLTQEQMRVLYKNGIDKIEIVEDKPTNTYDKKKKKHK